MSFREEKKQPKMMNIPFIYIRSELPKKDIEFSTQTVFIMHTENFFLKKKPGSP